MGNEPPVAIEEEQPPEYRETIIEEVAEGDIEGEVTELDRQLDAMDIIDVSDAFVGVGIGDKIEGRANIPNRREISEAESCVEASARLVDEALEAIARQTGMKPETILEAREDLLK
jgi:hypothetical protein